MSANVLEFRLPADRLESRLRPLTSPMFEQEITSRSLAYEMMYRIYCLDDDRLQNLAMEYFLLDCD